MSETKGHKEAFRAEDTKYIGRINTLDSKEVDVKKFPQDVSRIVRKKPDIERLFNVGSDVWKEAYDPILVTDLVNRLNDKDCKKKEREVIIREIMEIRKIGQLYRSAWQLFDVKHESPDELDRLIKAMGRLKDYPDDIGKNEKRLKNEVKTYNKKRRKIDRKFKACKVKGFRKFIRDTENKTGFILTKDEPRDVEKQHDVRKNGSRVFMNLLKLELIRDNNPYRKGRLNIEDAYFYFKAIDKKFGKAHDELYNDLRKGKKHSKMEIKKKTKGKLMEGMKILVDQWEDEIIKENKKKEKKKKKKQKDKKSERNKRKYEKEKRKKKKRKKKGKKD